MEDKTREEMGIVLDWVGSLATGKMSETLIKLLLLFIQSLHLD